MTHPQDPVDARIIKSRQTLAGYRAMLDAGQTPFELEGTLKLLNDEIAILSGLAEGSPGKRDKIDALIADWREIIRRMRQKAD